MPKILQHLFSNQLIRGLSPACFATLEPHLERVDLPKSFVLCEPNAPIKHLYFLESGVASIVMRALSGTQTEAGLFGREGLGPIAALLGAPSTPQKILMQVGGFGYRIAIQHLTDTVDCTPDMRRWLNLYAHVFNIQVASTAMSNATHTITKRLARWILMCHDRAQGDDIPLTHDFLAIMLAVRRPGVTVALHELEGEQLIRSSRGLVTIRDRKALEQFAADAYGVPEAEYDRLIGHSKGSMVKANVTLATARV